MTIREIRRQRGLTQEQVAQAVGIRQAYYSNIESGRANPTLNKLRRLAELLEVELGELVASIPEATAASVRRAKNIPGYLTGLRNRTPRISAILADLLL